MQIYIINNEVHKMTTYYVTAKNFIDAQNQAARKFNAGEKGNNYREHSTSRNVYVVTFAGRGLPDVALLSDLT